MVVFDYFMWQPFANHWLVLASKTRPCFEAKETGGDGVNAFHERIRALGVLKSAPMTGQSVAPFLSDFLVKDDHKALYY